MRPSTQAIAALAICALLLGLTRPLWTPFASLRFAAPVPEQQVAPLPAEAQVAAPVVFEEEVLITPAPEHDPWRQPLLSPITDATLPSWSAGVMARHARRSAMAELADVPVITDDSVEQPVREQQPQALSVKEKPAASKESRAQRKQRQAEAKRREQEANRQRLQLKLPPPETLLPPTDLDLSAARGVDVPDLLNAPTEPGRLQWHGRILTNEDIGRDPIEPPRNVLDEIQGAELGVIIKTQ